MRTLERLASLAGAALITCALGASIAQAQCAFPHGQSTGNNGWTYMAQAYVPCGAPDCDGYGGTPPNTSTQGGIPACGPPLTYHQTGGSPSGGWLLDTVTGRGRLHLDGTGSTDIKIRLQLRDIRDSSGSFASVGSTGQLKLVIRATFNDPVGGDMTQIDFPASFPVTISTATGDAFLNTTYNAFLTLIGQPTLPPCTNFEVMDVAVFDPNGNKFLRPGHFRL